MSRIRRSLRVLLGSVLLSAAWGIYEASFRFLTTYHVHAAHQPSSGVNLFLSALVNYGGAGVLVGLAAAPLMFLLASRKAGRDLREAPFIVATGLALLVGIYAGFTVRVTVLQQLPRTHPMLWLAGLGILAVSSIGGVLVYLVLSRAARSFETWAAAATGRRRLARLAAAALPAIFVAGGIVAGMGGSTGAASNGFATRPMATGDAPGAAARPNIILITIETTRADRVNFLGYRGSVTTPNLDALAARGVTFTRFFSQAPWTRPTMASLFTSLYPSQHGMTRSGTGLAADVVTLPQVLRDAGYRTATFYANLHAGSATFGFEEERGAFEPEDPYRISPLGGSPFLIGRIQVGLLFHGIRLTFPQDKPNWYIDAPRLNANAQRWLDGATADPIFLHMHYLDPHDPYFAHPYKVAQFDPRAEWNREELLERYDEEIRFVDKGIQQLLDDLERRGILENSILAVTADHGEEFYDHGGWGHRHKIFAELLHVPLILATRGTTSEPLGAGVRIDSLASTIDVAPTLLELAGVEVPEPFMGTSLVAAARGEEDARPVLSQLREQMGVYESYIDGEWKLIRIRKAKEKKYLFHILEDPGDLDNRIDAEPAVAARLEEALDRMVAALGSGRASEEPLSPEEREQLRALGYAN